MKVFSVLQAPLAATSGFAGTLRARSRPLLNELRLLVHPIVLGGGRRVFGQGMPKRTLQLADTRTFSSGVVLLTDHPAA